MMKYERLYDYTIENGGATVRVADYPEKMIVPVVGYAVATKISIPVRRDEFLLESFDTAVDRIIAQSKGKGYLGTWVRDIETILVEWVEVFANKSFAMGVAYGRNEEAVFDLDKKREIYLSDK